MVRISSDDKFLLLGAPEGLSSDLAHISTAESEMRSCGHEVETAVSPFGEQNGSTQPGRGIKLIG
jgi:hypothetical protein